MKVKYILLMTTWMTCKLITVISEINIKNVKKFTECNCPSVLLYKDDIMILT